jgi:uncharacterized membrane protein YhaH (DUF805 family)
MKWMIMPLRRYADFSGRSRRLEYWMFTLFIMLAAVAIMIPIAITGQLAASPDGELPFAGGFVAVLAIAFIAILIPSLAVQVRRFHDQNRSGWWVLLGFVPYIGSLVVLVFMLIEGTKGPNDYGPDPKSSDNYEEVFR